MSGAKDEIDWKVERGEELTHGLIIAGAFYVADGDPEPLWTIRPFVVSHRPNNVFAAMGIRREGTRVIDKKEIYLDLTGPTATK